MRFQHLFLIVLLVAVAGCVRTEAKFGKATLSTTRFLTDSGIDSVKLNPDGSAELTGYRSEQSKALDVAAELARRVPIVP